jgi:hypothetical protein
MIGTVFALTEPINQKEVFMFSEYNINPETIVNVKASIYINGRVAELGSLTLKYLSIRGVRND